MIRRKLLTALLVCPHAVRGYQPVRHEQIVKLTILVFSPVNLADVRKLAAIKPEDVASSRLEVEPSHLQSPPLSLGRERLGRSGTP